MSAEWPMLLIMVGRKTGRDEKAMLVQKNMNAVRYDFGSVKTVRASRHFKPGFLPVAEVERSGKCKRDKDYGGGNQNLP